MNGESIKIFSSDEFFRILVFEIATDCRDMMRTPRHMSHCGIPYFHYLSWVFVHLYFIPQSLYVYGQCEISLQAPQLAPSMVELVVARSHSMWTQEDKYRSNFFATFFALHLLDDELKNRQL